MTDDNGLHLLFRMIGHYVRDNPLVFYSYLFVCCLQYINNTIITSSVYSQLFRETGEMRDKVRNVAILWSAKLGLSFIRSRIEKNILPYMLRSFRMYLFEEYLHANELLFDDLNVGTDVRDMLELGRMLTDFVVWMVTTLIPTAVFVTMMTAYFWYKFPIAGGAVTTSLVINALIVNNSYSNMTESIDKKLKAQQKLTDFYEEMLQSMMNVFLNRQTEQCKSVNAEHEELVLPWSISEQHEIGNTTNYMRLNTYLFTAISLVMIYRSSEMVEFVNCLLLFTYYVSALEIVADDLPTMVRLFGRMKMVSKSLWSKIYHKLTLPEPTFPSNQLQGWQGHIEFRDVCFRYHTDLPNVIERLRWTIRPGERVALVAKSGQGKTTIMKLLLKFYMPQSGQILLGGADVAGVSADEIRSKINYINQKTVLFQDTIIGNMQYGNAKDYDSILSILEKYNLLHIFRGCDENPKECLNTPITLGGGNMSMGMQKVIFLIRGLLRQDTTVFVLDEPLTSVDPDSRKSIMQMISDMVGNRTMIIITHDDVSPIVHRTDRLHDLMVRH